VSGCGCIVGDVDAEHSETNSFALPVVDCLSMRPSILQLLFSLVYTGGVQKTFVLSRSTHERAFGCLWVSETRWMGRLSEELA